jgi:cysteine desulfurase
MDNHATTPVDPRVVEAMMPCFGKWFGNASSRSHAFGWQAEELVKRAREQVATLIGAMPREIIFTSGATESNNLAIKGVADAYRTKGNHIVTVSTEHPSVLDPFEALERKGFHATRLSVDSDGLIDLDELSGAITEETILASVMFANNETGVIQPIEEIGRICRDREVIFHSDATQAAGKIPIDVNEMALDLVSISAHKMYGPKGVGALYVRARAPRVTLAPLLDGGGHERGMRSGTLNVPGIVGLGEAAATCQESMSEESMRLKTLRDRLRDGLTDALDDVWINGHPERRLPNNLNVSFGGVKSEGILTGMSDVAVSAGAACASEHDEPSHVLAAMGAGPERAQSSIRFGLGRFNTEEDVDYVIEKTIAVVSRLRSIEAPRAAVGEDVKSQKESRVSSADLK